MGDDVTVPINQLLARALPPVCAKTGEPTKRGVVCEWADVPRWTYALILFGLFPFLAVQLAVGTRVKTKLPASGAVRLRRGLVVAGVGTAAVVALVLFFAAPIASSVALGVASVVFLAVARWAAAPPA